MAKLVWVETKKRKDMQAFVCLDCDCLFLPHAYWKISSTLWMHTNGTGHRNIMLLRAEVVEDSVPTVTYDCVI